VSIQALLLALLLAVLLAYGSRQSAHLLYWYKRSNTDAVRPLLTELFLSLIFFWGRSRLTGRCFFFFGFLFRNGDAAQYIGEGERESARASENRY